MIIGCHECGEGGHVRRVHGGHRFGLISNNEGNTRENDFRMTWSSVSVWDLGTEDHKCCPQLLTFFTIFGLQGHHVSFDAWGSGVGNFSGICGGEILYLYGFIVFSQLGFNGLLAGPVFTYGVVFVVGSLLRSSLLGLTGLTAKNRFVGVSLGGILTTILTLAFLTTYFATYNDGKANDDSSSNGALGVNSDKPLANSTTTCNVTIGGNVRLTISRVGTTNNMGNVGLRFRVRSSRTSTRGTMGTCGALGSGNVGMFVNAIAANTYLSIVDRAGTSGVFRVAPSTSTTGMVTGSGYFRIYFASPGRNATSTSCVTDGNLTAGMTIVCGDSSTCSSNVCSGFGTRTTTGNLSLMTSRTFANSDGRSFSSRLSGVGTSNTRLVFLPVCCRRTSLVLSRTGGTNVATGFFNYSNLSKLLGVRGFSGSLTRGMVLLAPFTTGTASRAAGGFITTCGTGCSPSALGRFTTSTCSTICIMGTTTRGTNIANSVDISSVYGTLGKTVARVAISNMANSNVA